MMPTRNQGDIKQLFRWSIIDGLFRTGKSYTAQELCDLVNEEIKNKEILNNEGGLASVTKRTINDDLKNMQQIFGSKIEIEELGSWQYRYYNKKTSIFSFTVSEDQERSFYLLLGFAKEKLDKFEYERIKSFIDEICANSNHTSTIDQYSNAYLVTSSTSSQERKWIDKLYESIIHRKALKVYYKKYGKNAEEKNLSVYGIEEYNGRWYMVAYDHLSLKTKVFKLDNIKSIENSDHIYFQSEDFDLVDYFEYSIGIFHFIGISPIHVKLEITNNATIERVEQNPIHHTQEVISKKDEILVISFDVYNTPELIQKIFELGADAKILEPKELIDEYKEHLEDIMERY